MKTLWDMNCGGDCVDHIRKPLTDNEQNFFNFIQIFYPDFT